MFILNFKLKKNFGKKLIVFLICFFCILLLFFCISKFKDKLFSSSDSTSPETIETSFTEIKTDNYTTFLKDSHENIDKYIGKQITLIGFVYRLPDFKEDQFVIARTMLVNNNSQAVIVGILSESKIANDFKNNTWVKCSGIIKKGYYNGDIPVLDISNITKIDPPEELFVNEPKSNTI